MFDAKEKFAFAKVLMSLSNFPKIFLSSFRFVPFSSAEIILIKFFKQRNDDDILPKSARIFAKIKQILKCCFNDFFHFAFLVSANKAVLLNTAKDDKGLIKHRKRTTKDFKLIYQTPQRTTEDLEPYHNKERQRTLN